MKNKKALILLLIANIISGVAQGISMIAIPWYFAKQGELGFFIWFYILANVIALVWVPYSGTLIDKYSRKTIFLFTNAISAFILGSVSLYGFHNGFLSAFAVAFVFVMTMMNYSIHYPCFYAFIQEITPKRFYTKVTSLLEIQGQATNIVGGAAAALLLEGSVNGFVKIFGINFNAIVDFKAWQIHEIFLLDSLTYVISFFIILSIHFIPLVERTIENTSIMTRLKTGWDFLIENKITFLFGVCSYIVFVCLLVEAFYLGALYTESHLHESGDVYASSDIAYACGAIISGLVIRFVFRKVSLPFGIIVLFFLTSIVFIVLGISDSVNVFYFMLFLLGLSNAGIRIQRVTYLFNNIPNQVFGRTNSIFNIANIFIRVILLLIFALPFFRIDNNVIYAFFIMTIVLLVAIIVMLINYKKFDLTVYQ